VFEALPYVELLEIKSRHVPLLQVATLVLHTLITSERGRSNHSVFRARRLALL
jgi:hypothetical protein